MMAPFRTALTVILAVIVFSANVHAQGNWKENATAFQAQLNADYADTAHSPLLDEEALAFKGHDFFQISKAFCVKAKFVRTPDEKPFDMMTSSGKTKLFVKYGELQFKISGQDFKLSAFQRLNLPNGTADHDDLFIPFKDHTSGDESYGGGRYMDIKIPEGKTITLDFNQCYNPYCAYSTGWNCPIPPQENYLEIKILAGVKAWDAPH